MPVARPQSPYSELQDRHFDKVLSGMATRTYQPIPQSLLDEANDHQLLQNVYEHLFGLLGDQWHPLENIDLLEAVPVAARRAWYVWWFEAEVGGSGISGWLVDHAPAASVIIGSHEALTAMGARDALELLEAGMAPAQEWDAPFLQSPHASWFGQFPGNPKWPNFEVIDPASFTVCAIALSTIAADYLRQHRSTL